MRGPVSKRVLLRVAGPTLGNLGLAGALRDPQFEVRDDSGRVVARNDDWQVFAGRPGAVESADLAMLSRVTARVGAFAFVSESKDAAILVTLAPGNYTLLASSVDGGAGVALIEIYEVPE